MDVVFYFVCVCTEAGRGGGWGNHAYWKILKHLFMEISKVWLYDY